MIQLTESLPELRGIFTSDISPHPLKAFCNCSSVHCKKKNKIIMTTIWPFVDHVIVL